MAAYFYSRNGLRFGPVSSGQLKELAAQGQLRPDDKIWKEGLLDWVPAAQVKGLFAKGAPPVAAPLPIASPIEVDLPVARPIGSPGLATIGAKGAPTASLRRPLIIAGAMVGTALLVVVGVVALNSGSKDGVPQPPFGPNDLNGPGGPSRLPDILKSNDQFKNLIAVVGSESGRHWQAIRSVAYSADGKTIASGGDDKVIRLWDAGTLQPRAVLSGHEDAVLALAFSADGKRLASGSADKSVRLWDLNAKPPASELLKWSDSWVAGVAFSPDGKWLASADATGSLVLWDLARANIKIGHKLSGVGGIRQTLFFSPDSSHLVQGTDEIANGAIGGGFGGLPAARLWKLTGTEPRLVDTFFAHPFAFNKDGTKLGVILGKDPVWSELDKLGDLTERPGLPGGSNKPRPNSALGSMAVAPSTLRIAGPGVLRHGEGVFASSIKLPGVTATSAPVTFSPHERSLVTCAGDRLLKLWNVGDDRPTESVPFPPADGSPLDMVFSANGKVFATSYNNAREHAFIWDLGGDAPKLRAKIPFGGYGRSAPLLWPDGNTLGLEGPRIHTKTGKGFNVKETFAYSGFQIVDLTTDPPKVRATIKEGKECGRVALAADGKTLVTVFEYGKNVIVWDVSAPEPRIRNSFNAKESLVRVALSPDGKIFAGTHFDRAGGSPVTLWNVAGSDLQELGTIPASTVAFLPDGVTLIGRGLWDVSGNRPRQLLADVSSGEPLGFLADGKTLVTRKALFEVSHEPPRVQDRLQAGHTFRVNPTYDPGFYSFQLKPAFGQTVLVKGAFPGAREGAWSSRLYKVEGYTTTKARPAADGHIGAVLAVSISADGKRIVTGGEDKTARLWQISNDSVRQTAVITDHQGAVKAVTFSPDGKTLATGSADKSVILWDVTGEKPTESYTFSGIGVAIKSLAFAPDGKTLAIASDEHGVGLWDVTGKKPVERMKLDGSAMAFDRTGKLLAVGATLWDVSGKLPAEKGKFMGWSTQAMALSPDGKRLATGSKNGVALYDVNVKEWGKEIALEGTKSETTALVYSKDGKLVAGADATGRILVWNAAGKKLAEWNMPGPVHALTFTGDCRYLVSGNHNGTAYVFHLSTLR